MKMSVFWPGPERLNQLMVDLLEEFEGFKGNLGWSRPTTPKRGVFTEVFVAVGGLFGSILGGIANLFTYENMEKIREDQAALIYHQNALDHDLEIVEENQLVFKNSIEEVKNYVHLEALAHKYEERMEHNIEILRKVNSAFTSLHHGLTPKSLFSVQEAHLTYQHLVKQAAADGKQLTIDSGLALYFLETSFFIVNHTLDFYIHVDCFSAISHFFDLFEISFNLPIIAINDTVFEILVEDRFIGATNTLASDREIITLPTLDQCNEFEPKKFICKNNFAIQKIYDNSCLANLFLFSSTANCKLHKASMEPRFWYSFQHQLVLFFAQPTEVAIVCKDETKNQFPTLHGIVAFTLENSCTFRTDYFYIRGKLESHLETSLVSRSVEFNLHTSFPNNTQEMYKQVVVKTGNRTRLMMKQAVYHNDVQFGLLGMCIFVSVMIIIFLIVRSCQLRLIPLPANANP